MMNLTIQFALWTSVITFLCSSGEPDVFNWTAVLPYFSKLCEITEDRDKSTADYTNTEKRVKNPCCKGCDYDPSCIADGKPMLYSGITQCISSHGDKNSVRGNNYKFVVDEPKDGCELVTDTQSKRMASCGKNDDDFKSLNTFYPVYSFDKGMNFKNKLCALCHGARNITEWNVYGFYRIGDLYDINIFNSQNWSKASFEYYPPNVESQQDENTCYELIDNCPDEFGDIFYIPSDITMTRQNIMDACNEGPVSHYIRTKKVRYKNVFCALCNAYASGRTDTVNCDRSILDEDFDREPTARSPNKPFAFLINHLDTGSVTDEDKNVPSPVYACLKNGNTACDKKKEVYCPTLQIRQPDGRCDFPMENAFIGKILISVNLTAPHIPDVSRLRNMAIRNLESLFRMSMPWARKWEIVSILLRVDELENHRSEFVVIVGYQVFDVLDIANLTSLIEDTVSKDWIINLRGQAHAFKQDLLTHGQFEQVLFHNEAFMKPKWSLQHTNDSGISNLPSPTWKMLFSNLFRFYSSLAIEIPITKLFFCNQVKLDTHEYTCNSSFLPIFLKRQNRFLYPYEFYMHESVEGDDDMITMICLEDSDYHIVQSNSKGHSLYTGMYNVMVCIKLLIFSQTKLF